MELEQIRRIRTTTCHYSILQISKDCSPEDLKKAYRKLALVLHPDKCTAPGCEEAFKKVGTAYSILSDASKRRDYDRFGDDSTTSTPFARRGGPRMGPDDVDVMDLFNMMFGGAPGGMYMYRTHNGMGRQAFHQQRGPQPHVQTFSADLNSILRLFLPLITIFIFLWSMTPAAPEPLFSLSPDRSRGYIVPRQTSDTTATKYYVKTSFAKEVTRSDLPKVERQVLYSSRQHYMQLCQMEKEQKEQLRREAAHGWTAAQRSRASAQVRAPFSAVCTAAWASFVLFVPCYTRQLSNLKLPSCSMYSYLSKSMAAGG